MRGRSVFFLCALLFSAMLPESTADAVPRFPRWTIWCVQELRTIKI